MIHRGILLACVLVTAAVGAGCFGAEEEPVTTFSAAAEGAKFTRGWAYDGAGVVAGTGSALINLDAARNTGSVTATFAGQGVAVGFGTDFPFTGVENFVTFTAPEEAWAIDWSNFEGSADFHEGGVVLNLREHGASGVGDTSIPEVLLLAAAWGEASLKRNGANYGDPLTGKNTWKAHLMVMDEGVRAADGQIKNADGSVYDPANAAAGTTSAGKQVWIVLRTHPGDRILEDFEETITVSSVNEPEHQGPRIDVPVAVAGAAMKLTFTLDSEVPPPSPPLSELTFVVKDPSENEVFRQTLDRDRTEAVFAGTVGEGEYIVEVSGRGVAGKYHVHKEVVYPPEIVLVFQYDNVVIPAP